MVVDRKFRGMSYVDFPPEYCLVDIETTGRDFYHDEIIEIGAIKYSCGQAMEQFQTLVQPSIRDGVFVSEFIENLTGITNEMLSDAPLPCVAIKNFEEFLGGSVIVGYNVSFDVNFLYDCYMKHLQRPLTNNFIDVLRIAKRLCTDLPRRDLDSVMNHFGLKVDNRHRTIGDCLAAELVYERLQKEALSHCETLQDFGKTFKMYANRQPKQLMNDVLEEWKQELYSCPSVYKAFKFLDKLNLKKNQLTEFADYLGIDLYKYADKTEITHRLVYATVGEKLKDDPVRKRNIEKYKRNTANNGVTFILSFADKETNTEKIEGNVAMSVCEKCGMEFEGSGVYCSFCQWHMKWSEQLLNSPDLASRRKRSHDVKILSLNPEVPEATFLGSKPKNSECPTYHTTLADCTCVDFIRGGGARPCKHIFRLAEELGLFQNEYFLSGEYDYTMKNPSYVPGERKIPQDGVYSCDFVWRTRWAHEVLYSIELTSRRKFSHSVKILSVNQEKTEAICQDPDDTKTYVTTLTSCTCDDYSFGFGIRPCKHIFRLAEELNLFQCEYDVLNYGNDVRLDFSQLDDSKASKTRRRLIFNEWKELLYGFNTVEDGVEFIMSLKLTIPQLKEFSHFEKIQVVFSGRKKSEIIDAIVEHTTGHSHRQLLRWLAEQIYKYNDLEECKEFLTGLNLTISQIIEFAEFKQIKLLGSNEKELIESLVAQTVGKKAINGGNVIVINFDVDADRLKLKELCEMGKLLQADEGTGTKEADVAEVQNTQEEMIENPPVISPVLSDTAESLLVAEDPIKEKSSVPSIFLKLLKYVCGCVSGFFALVLLAGAFAYGMQTREWLCFPAAFAIAGFLTANTAKRNALGGSAFKWWLYGAIVPVVSWIDVVESCSQNKVKGFMKGILYSLLGILAFLVVFAQFLPAVPKQAIGKEIQIERLHSIYR